MNDWISLPLIYSWEYDRYLYWDFNIRFRRIALNTKARWPIAICHLERVLNLMVSKKTSASKIRRRFTSVREFLINMEQNNALL
jgi:hypothetical protein